jgi:hypothetical protein
MAKTKTKVVLKILLIIVCVLSLAAGIFSTVSAVKQRQIYNENIKVVNVYVNQFESDSTTSSKGRSKRVTSSSYYWKVNAKEKADDAKILAEDAKKQMTKFTALAGVLYFVTLMMLICIIAVMKPKKSKK